MVRCPGASALGEVELWAVGHVVRIGLDGRVRFAGLEKNCDSGNLAVAGTVHQVGNHVVGPAVDVLFAGTVKVELR